MGSVPDLTKQKKSALSGWHISRASNMASIIKMYRCIISLVFHGAAALPSIIRLHL